MFFQRGFFIIGSLFNNPLLKIISIVLSALLTLVLGFDIISVYSSAELEMVRAGASLSFGVVGVLFGISLIKLNHSFGTISLLAGGLEIIAGCFFVTTALFFVGFLYRFLQNY